MNILFLCTANIQRSKTAEVLFHAANNNYQYFQRELALLLLEQCELA